MSNLITPYAITMVSGADLRGATNRIAAADPNRRVVLCASGSAPMQQGGPIGVIYNTPASLEALTLAIGQRAQIWTAASLSPFTLITAGSMGGAVPAGSGDVVIARAIEWAVPGSLVETELNTPFRLTSAA